MKPRLKQN